MESEHTIEGKTVLIDWDFDEIIERHDSNWCEWLVKGFDDDGNEYTGECQADGNHPEDMHDHVSCVELIEKTKP